MKERKRKKSKSKERQRHTAHTEDVYVVDVKEDEPEASKVMLPSAGGDDKSRKSGSDREQSKSNVNVNVGKEKADMRNLDDGPYIHQGKSSDSRRQVSAFAEFTSRSSEMKEKDKSEGGKPGKKSEQSERQARCREGPVRKDTFKRTKDEVQESKRKKIQEDDSEKRGTGSQEDSSEETAGLTKEGDSEIRKNKTTEERSKRSRSWGSRCRSRSPKEDDRKRRKDGSRESRSRSPSRRKSRRDSFGEEDLQERGRSDGEVSQEKRERQDRNEHRPRGDKYGDDGRSRKRQSGDHKEVKDRKKLREESPSEDVQDGAGGTSQDEEVFNQDSIEAVPTSAGALVIFPHPMELVLRGRVCVQVLYGSVSILGHTLNAGEKQYKVFSQETGSLLSILTLSGVKCEEIVGDAQQLFDDKRHLKYLLQKFQNRTIVVLQFQTLDSPMLDFVSTLPPYQQPLERPSSDMFGARDVNQVLSPLGVSLHTEMNFPVVWISEDYQYVIDMWTKALTESDVTPKVALCGAKNCGKSTMNRVLLNTTLNHVPSVCYLECDVGQTEFTPPGCLSLHLLTEPVLGPPYSHQQQAIHSCYFGGVSPADDPGHYINCLESVVQAYQRMDSRVPLVVNTMGWVQGLGLQLLIDTLNMSKPSLIVQLEGRNVSMNCPALVEDFILNEPGWLNYSADSAECDERLPWKQRLIMVATVVDKQTEQSVKLKPIDHRDLSLLAYLASDLQPGITLTSMLPYTLPWKSVALHICHVAVAPSQILYALNASVVALCEADLTKTHREDGEGPMLFDTTPVCRCLGFGIVRGINPDNKLLFILTPLSPAVLPRVNTLMKGATGIPDHLLMKQKGSTILPYVDDTVSSLGAGAVRQRRHMPRKYPQNESFLNK